MAAYDLKNHKFDRWLVRRKVKYEKQSVWWLCKCDCGNERVIRATRLVQGKTKSCGCHLTGLPSNKGQSVVVSKEEIYKRLYNVHKGNITFNKPYPGRIIRRAEFICDKKHVWEAPTSRVLGGHGCPECKKERQRLKYVLSEKEIHRRLKGRQFKALEPYHNIARKVKFLCLICQNVCRISFNAAMNRKHGCPTCANNARRATGGYSDAAIEWITKIGNRLRLKFNHIECGGEYKIDLGFIRPTSVDGYNESKRIVLEFDGDYWHKRNDKRRKEYRRTIRRTNELLKLGYVVIHVWEKDFKQGNLGTMLNPYRHNFKKLANKLGITYTLTRRIDIL